MIESSSGLPQSGVFGNLQLSSEIFGNINFCFSSVCMRLSCCIASLPVPGGVWLDVSGRCLPVCHDR